MLHQATVYRVPAYSSLKCAPLEISRLICNFAVGRLVSHRAGHCILFDLLITNPNFIGPRMRFSWLVLFTARSLSQYPFVCISLCMAKFLLVKNRWHVLYKSSCSRIRLQLLVPNFYEQVGITLISAYLL